MIFNDCTQREKGYKCVVGRAARLLLQRRELWCKEGATLHGWALVRSMYGTCTRTSAESGTLVSTHARVPSAAEAANTRDRTTRRFCTSPSARCSANTRDRTTRRFCTSPSARCRRTHPRRSAEKKQKEKTLLNLGPATCIMISYMSNRYDYIKAPIHPLM
jgi:hypothetical protein